MKTSDRHQHAPTPIRLPDDLKAALKCEAAMNDRSLNGEIVNRLRSTFKGKRTRQPSAEPTSTDTVIEQEKNRERQLAFQQPDK